MTGGLDAFVPETIRVTLPRGPVDVRPLTVGQLPGFGRAVTPIMPLLLSGQIVPALMADPEAFFEAVAISTGLPTDELKALDPAHFIPLAQAVIEVNVDFFDRRLLPAARAAEQAILARMARLTDPTGDLSSLGSANAATG